MKRFIALLLAIALLVAFVPAAAAFSDVPEGAWYADEVASAVRRGWMRGTAPDRFSPDEAATRAALVTILFRMEGEPQARDGVFSDVPDGAFSDVPDGAWYEPAVRWACAEALAGGYGDDRFGPDDALTREQTAVFLYRYARYCGRETPSGALNAFPDAASVSPWASEAMGWAVAQGILNGSRDGGQNRLCPQQTTTRAQLAALLCRFLPEQARPQHGEGFRAAGDTVAYLPLDNRPVNDQRSIYLAQSANLRILQPDEALYATRLDGQSPNANGTAYGDREALFAWLLAVEPECDALIVSADQLLSGGLVSSRWMDDTDLTREFEMIDALAEIAKRKPVYVFDTVMRLATTLGYAGLGHAEYSVTRAYGKLTRRELTGEELTLENIVTGYRYDENGEEIVPALPEEILTHYLAARQRKLRLGDYLVRHGQDFAHLLIGVDDSSARTTIQSNEIRYLRALLGENGLLLCGTDELGLMQIARAYGALGGETYRYSVRYFGGGADEVADAYDFGTLRESVDLHLQALGAAQDESCFDLQALVLTRSSDEQAAQELMQAWRENDRRGVPTVVINASARAQSCETLPVRWLMGYSSWGTAANAIGIALSMGQVRLQWLTGEREKGSSDAFVQGLLFAFLKDLAYCRDCRPTMSDLTPEGIEAALMQTPRTAALAALLTGKTLCTGETIPPYRLTDFSAPLARSYEIRFRIELER